MSKQYYIIEETTWAIAPREQSAVGTCLFTAKLTQERADEYREDGFFQNGKHIDTPKLDEDDFNTTAISYSKIVVDKWEYKKFKKIINKYDRLATIF